MYADDTTLYFNLKNFAAQNRSMLINNELERVNTWLKFNKLALNVEKTKGMIFHERRIIEHTKWSMNIGLINVKDMFSLKILNFLHKLSHNMLPPYFESYKPFLEKIATPYFLRPHPLTLPPTSHVYAESGIIYQLVHMKKISFL